VNLCACGTPNNLKETEYKACVKAVEILDGYLDFEISKDDAKKQLEEISNRINYDDADGERETALLTLSVSISAATWELTHESPDDEEILEQRNDIAKAINQNERTK
jgi:hypothetical protein